MFAWSIYPYSGAGFFMENPTAMFRVAAFEAVAEILTYLYRANSSAGGGVPRA